MGLPPAVTITKDPTSPSQLPWLESSRMLWIKERLIAESSRGFVSGLTKKAVKIYRECQE